MPRKIIVANNILLDEVAKIIDSGEQVILLAKGQSMLPFIVGGRDSVELSPVDGQISPGDILLAKLSCPERYVVHRVIKIQGEQITLMGDGNIIGTERCRVQDVVARVSAIVKPHKRIDPNSKSQQRYVIMWSRLLLVRRYILAILRRVFY